MKPPTLQHALELVKLISTWSLDEPKQGAIILNDVHRVIGLGYSGFHKGLEPIGTSEGVVHAAASAVLQFTQAVEGGTLVTTDPPCAHCCYFVAKAGVKRVIIPGPNEFRDLEPIWKVQYLEARMILQELGVQLSMVW